MEREMQIEVGSDVLLIEPEYACLNGIEVEIRHIEAAVNNTIAALPNKALTPETQAEFEAEIVSQLKRLVMN